LFFFSFFDFLEPPLLLPSPVALALALALADFSFFSFFSYLVPLCRLKRFSLPADVSASASASFLLRLLPAVVASEGAAAAG